MGRAEQHFSIAIWHIYQIYNVYQCGIFARNVVWMVFVRPAFPYFLDRPRFAPTANVVQITSATHSLSAVFDPQTSPRILRVLARFATDPLPATLCGRVSMARYSLFTALLLPTVNSSLILLKSSLFSSIPATCTS